MADTLVAEYEVARGPQRGLRLSLYQGRVAVHGGDDSEVVALPHLASVRVAFERDAAKLNWGIVLAVLALAAFAASGPLQGWIGATVARLSEHARTDSLDSLLLVVMTVLGGAASLLPALAGALVAGAVALAVYFWLGRTTLTLYFAGTERACAVRGRDRRLIEFAELIADQVAALSPRRGG